MKKSCIEMDNLEKKHYRNLRNNFSTLIKLILGNNYYTMSIHVLDSDEEAFNDMVKEIYKIKYNLRMYRRLFYYMVIFTLILFIYSIIN